MRGVIFSDSVLCVWDDPVEGMRFALDFMIELSRRVDRSIISFRGFLDQGVVPSEYSILAYAYSSSHQRLVRVVPPSVALWSVSLAEASHFPAGQYVAESLVPSFNPSILKEEPYIADQFKYRMLNI